MQLIHKDRSLERGKSCKQCGRDLNELYPHEYCPICAEINLFNEVKEYIRENDVNEQNVAEHFNLPVSKVRGWIREGKIQYKGGNKISSVFCNVCGKPISFGRTCPECHSFQNLHIVAKMRKEEQAEMHYFNKSSK